MTRYFAPELRQLPTTNTSQLLGQTNPSVQVFVLHAQSLGVFHYAVAALGHFADHFRFEFREVSRSLHGSRPPVFSTGLIWTFTNAY